MEAKILDGRALSEKIQAELKIKIEAFKQAHGLKPELVVILVGDNPASQVYVRNKETKANSLGFASIVERVPENISEQDLISLIDKYNQKPDCHGILVQLPLPAHLDEQRILKAIDHRKDVDGFHPVNVGNFFLGNDAIKPCTPLGIMRLLEAYDIPIEGKHAVVVGRSNIVGKPVAQMLLQKNASVTIVHSRTTNLKELTRQADILVVAIGKGHFITQEHVKPGAVVIDVGMNHNQEGKLIGDVHHGVHEVASYMTPVPGGVGPMTIAMLLEQTYQNAVRMTL